MHKPPPSTDLLQSPRPNKHHLSLRNSSDASARTLHADHADKKEMYQQIMSGGSLTACSSQFCANSWRARHSVQVRLGPERGAQRRGGGRRRRKREMFTKNLETLAGKKKTSFQEKYKQLHHFHVKSCPFWIAGLWKRICAPTLGTINFTVPF